MVFLSEIRPENGVRNPDTPEWARQRCSLANAFPIHNGTTLHHFATEAYHTLSQLPAFKPRPDGAAYLGHPSSAPDYTSCMNATLQHHGHSLSDVMQDSIALFDGMHNLAHPLTMPNVIPPPNKAAILSSMMASTFGANLVHGEYSWNVAKAELESAAMLSQLIGWDPAVAGGLYTYGGSGCALYALKFALTQVLGVESRLTGIRTDGKVLVSRQGHYSKMNCTDWAGLGMNNIIEISTDEDTNSMDLDDLETTMAMLHSKKIPVISVICTMGTTDAFAIDDVRSVRMLIEKYPNAKPYGQALLYCDAVIGWSYLTFKTYDFQQNELEFSVAVAQMLRKNLIAMSAMKYADAAGIDFHKTGWANYNCSIFLTANSKKFEDLMTRPGSAYLQERTSYNPGRFTLETTRGGAAAMAGWATLKLFGAKGFQTLLGGALEMQSYLCGKIRGDKSIVCVNERNYGCVTLFRVYPSNINAAYTYTCELQICSNTNMVSRYNALQEQIANYMWTWFRSGEKRNGMYGPYMSFTSGFRSTKGGDKIFALKVLPMNVTSSYETMDDLMSAVIFARDEVIANKRWSYAKDREESTTEMML